MHLIEDKKLTASTYSTKMKAVDLSTEIVAFLQNIFEGQTKTLLIVSKGVQEKRIQCFTSFVDNEKRCLRVRIVSSDNGSPFCCCCNTML